MIFGMNLINNNPDSVCFVVSNLLPVKKKALKQTHHIYRVGCKISVALTKLLDKLLFPNS